MNTINRTMTILAGVLFLAYDLWLIDSGQFHPALLVGLAAWLGLLVLVCAITKSCFSPRASLR